MDIPVCYGGEAGLIWPRWRHTGLTPAEVVKQHCAAEYQVFFMGFQPGFAYLGGLPEALATPGARARARDAGRLGGHWRQPDRRVLRPAAPAAGS